MSQMKTLSDDIVNKAAIQIFEVFNRTSFNFLEGYDLIEPLIERCLIFNLIKDVKLPEELCQKLLVDYLKKNKYATKEEMETKLIEKGISIDHHYEEIYRIAKINLKAVQLFKSEAFKTYQRKINDYTNIVYSIMRVSSKAEALEYYYQLVNGESTFSDLARTFSEGFEKDTNGLIGPVPLSQPHPLIQNRLVFSKPGEVIEPFYYGELWNILRLEHRKDSDYGFAIENKLCMELLGHWIKSNVLSVKVLLEDKLSN